MLLTVTQIPYKSFGMGFTLLYLLIQWLPVLGKGVGHLQLPQLWMLASPHP